MTKRLRVVDPQVDIGDGLQRAEEKFRRDFERLRLEREELLARDAFGRAVSVLALVLVIVAMVVLLVTR